MSLQVQYVEHRTKYGILCKFGLFCEYINLEYVRIRFIYRVKGALQLLINRYG